MSKIWTLNISHKADSSNLSCEIVYGSQNQLTEAHVWTQNKIENTVDNNVVNQSDSCIRS